MSLSTSQPKTPIAVFGYNRPDKLSKTLSHLTECKNFHSHPVHIFLDHSSNNCSKAIETQEIANAWASEYNAQLTIRDKKLYFANITNAIDELFKDSKQLIILEDDICPHPLFLDYMESALKFYKDDMKVHFISAYTHPLFQNFTSESCFQPSSNTLSIWGWATWADRWANYRKKSIPSSIEISDKEISTHDYLSTYKFSAQHKRALKNKQNNNKATPWGNFWIYDGWQEKRLILTPKYPLIWNIGTEGGTHGSLQSEVKSSMHHLNIDFKTYMKSPNEALWDFPKNTQVDWSFFHSTAHFLKWQKRSKNYIKIAKKLLFIK